MYRRQWLIAIPLVGILLFAGCKEEEEEPEEPVQKPKKEQIQVNVPDFSADSAYYYIQKQVEFGPRVPGTEGHARTAEWLQKKMSAYFGAAQVQVQETKVRMYNGKVIDAKNIITTYNPEIKNNRILLFAHWDTRMFADHDTERRKEPIPGANDGASGVAVLLEIARQLHDHPIDKLGIDIIFFDAEDQGIPSNMGYNRNANSSKTWCLGSQYWAKNPHNRSYRYQYGILLDMVGSENASFPKEGYSAKYAPNLTDMVWRKARSLGHGNYFLNHVAPEIMDDHYYINTLANIPAVDIIHLDPRNGSFGDFWHTHDDDMANISRSTLHAVGETVMHVVWGSGN